MKKVSIIVPIYKSEKYIEKLIQSVINQTYKNIELILVDDESPDNSGKICDEYAKKDNRIVVIHKKNGGCSEARNTGLEHVTGDYLTFIDGDDWIESDCIEYFVSLMEKNDCQMAMSDCLFTTRDRKQNAKDNIRVWDSERALCCIFYVETPVAAWNKMYKTDIIKKNNIKFEISWFGEGLYFSSMGAQYSDRIVIGHKKVYDYRKNNPNSGTTVRKVQDGINALEHSIWVKNRIKNMTPRVEAATNWHIWKNNLNLVTYIIGSGEKKKYLKEYHKAIHQVRAMMKDVFIHSEVNIKQKIIILVGSLFPRTISKLVLFRDKQRFKKDVMI